MSSGFRLERLLGADRLSVWTDDAGHDARQLHVIWQSAGVDDVLRAYAAVGGRW